VNAAAATRHLDLKPTHLAVAAFLFPSLVLLGCKADSSTTTDAGTNAAPTSTTVVEAKTPTTATAEATQPAGAAPTATPQLTATPEAAGIEVIGDDAFKAWADQALALIAEKAPQAYQEVTASIKVIESVPAGSGMYVDEKRFAVGDETAHAPGYDDDRQLLWFAGTVVHDAHHSALYSRNEPHTGKDAEIACLTAQKAALALMTDDPFFANYVQGLIDGADDPANQYWNQPNRHW
jgi:hypothetical protein